MTKEENKNMMIANCRICLLSKSNCADCPLNWALDMIDIEKTLKVVEIPTDPFLRFAEGYLKNIPNGAK